MKKKKKISEETKIKIRKTLIMDFVAIAFLLYFVSLATFSLNDLHPANDLSQLLMFQENKKKKEKKRKNKSKNVVKESNLN